MTHWLFAAALGAVLSAGQPALAQRPSRGDDVKKLEAELDKLRSQLKDVEARLQKAREAEKRAGDGWRGRWWGPGWGRMDSDRMKEMREQWEKRQKEAQKQGEKKDDRRSGWWGGWRWGRGWRGWGPGDFGRDGRRPAESGKSSDVERRLDRLLKEVEELRKELRKK